jgi:hypothetical protein
MISERSWLVEREAEDQLRLAAARLAAVQQAIGSTEDRRAACGPGFGTQRIFAVGRFANAAERSMLGSLGEGRRALL